MKKISFVVLILLSFYSYSQVKNSMDLLLKAFKMLPERVLIDSYGELTEKKRNDIINYYSSLNDKDSVTDLIEFEGFYGDVGVYYELKGFAHDTNYLIGYANRFSTFSTTEAGNIYFFQYENSKLVDITSSVLGSFNYFTDNLKRETIDSLSSFYEKDLSKSPVQKKLLFNFTISDTIAITFDFIDYYYMRDENLPGLDKNSSYFDGQFYTKKYIMENGKLRLAE